MAPPSPPLMLTTGPVTAYPEVSEALSRPILYDGDDAFRGYYAQVLAMLGRVMGLSTPPVILQGEAILGIEAAAAGLIGPKDVVLNLVSGVYGQGFGRYALRAGAEVIELAVPFDAAIDPADVARSLRARPDIGVVAVCHHDTPSGTLNPLADIGAVVAAHGALLIVDAVSSFGGMEVFPEAVAADLFITSPAKCLGGTPGLSLLGVSDRAWAKMRANPQAPRGSFLSLLDWQDVIEDGRTFPVTPSIAEIYGLEAALARHLAEGERAVWARHALTARATRAGILALGLALWPTSEALCSPTTTAIRIPDGLSDKALRDHARDRSGVLLSLGRGATAGKVLRIGHMGPAAQPDHALRAVAALAAAASAQGLAVDRPAGESAVRAVIDGM
ncbi:aminotransferase, class V [Rhodospirillum rubrum F11]|uniref:Aminotransferase, class V n=2 Tax=Rhodospirillum rubrum TaxID=1085 RepID=Q2RST5_RHORT|nr:alanine--glyoxylate aminotransferase family protein [Rhodospirillum rubrum]ABC22810.1 Aminotransferase, class V [Rhodospirillum rubrum ATCC 11170]AEO48532.1 aminotransferase, class V [Rhodospirillum rubrum F11]MBK5954408.1 alanine--glyoxylate aminotransferase family protein [Rhodospirillum rubrum]QXG78800.1 alanine--glyoxylate aminotransferase family protein [Rhodospirillum rubrum]HAP98553.1 alanine--glyoxylate aminotransferase family protein [Rhodospirillum rubrum]